MNRGKASGRATQDSSHHSCVAFLCLQVDVGHNWGQCRSIIREQKSRGSEGQLVSGIAVNVTQQAYFTLHRRLAPYHEAGLGVNEEKHKSSENLRNPHAVVHHVYQVIVPAARRLCSFLCPSHVQMPRVSCSTKNQMLNWYHVHKHKISSTWHPGPDRVVRLREHPEIFQGRNIPYPLRKTPDRSPGVPLILHPYLSDHLSERS